MLERDLRREWNADIRDWHQGNTDAKGCLILSSRLFLSLVRGLSDKSEFRTDAPYPFGRDGDWSEAERMMACIQEDLAKFVGAQLQTEWFKFHSPVEVKRLAEEDEAEGSAEELIDSLFGADE